MTYIIAEIGVNHDGDFKRAKKLVDLAANAGANAAKFQMFITEGLIHKETRQADYQASNIGKQQAMARRQYEDARSTYYWLSNLYKDCDRGVTTPRWPSRCYPSVPRTRRCVTCAEKLLIPQ